MTAAYVTVCVVALVASHVWARRRAGCRTNWSATVYLGWTLLGALAPIAALFGLIGLEELVGGALVPERLPLVTGLLLLLGLLASVVGAAREAWRRRTKS